MNFRLAPFLQVKVSVVNSAGESFCWNYATDTFYGNYAGDNVCFEVVLFVNGMLVDLSVGIKQVTVSVAIMQLKVSGAHMPVTVSAANMWVTIFVVIMQLCRWYSLQYIMHMIVAIVIMKVTLSFIAM